MQSESARLPTRHAYHQNRKAPFSVLSTSSPGAGDNEEVLQMCDYSLQSVKSRPAKIGEKLRTQHFNTGTIGTTKCPPPVPLSQSHQPSVPSTLSDAPRLMNC